MSVCEGSLELISPDVAGREVWPATGGQQALFLAEQTGPADGAYNVPTVLEIDGPISDADLLAAGRRLVADTAALRLRFGLDLWTGDVKQWFVTEPPDIESVELPGDAAPTTAEYAAQRAREPFEPDEGALCRLIAVRRGPERAALVLVTHHLVFDGVSHLALARQMADAVTGASVEQSEREYGELLHHVLGAEAAARERDADFWHERLPSGVRLPSWLPPETAGPPSATAEGRRSTDWTELRTENLDAAANVSEAGLFSLLTAAVHQSLPTVGGDLGVVCAATSLRPRSGSHDHVLGYFVNAVPLVAVPCPDEPVQDLAARCAPEWKEALRRRAFPFLDLTTRPAARVAPGTARLDSVALTYRATPGILSRAAGGLSFALDPITRYPAAKNELSIRFFRHPGHLAYEVQWGRHLPAGLGERFCGASEAAFFELSSPRGGTVD